MTSNTAATGAGARELRRQFADRAELESYLRTEFPAAAGGLSPIRGGRRAAASQLAALRPGAYGPTRNYLSGAVSRLSPYVRHGVLSLRELREAGDRSFKFVQELAWRDYWQRLYAMWGNGIWEDREPAKTGVREYAAELPEDIPAGRTGLACMDAFAAELRETGYLHNHARMWVAAYVVHFRRVRWQAGARWFLQHLLDGDPASNNLSWQWVASTFGSRPYIFNRENLERYTEGRYCRGCTAQCPFAASYDELGARLFPR
jgi:deoxyribodipyrimidine photo-lyase